MKFQKKTGGKPEIPTASLPDIIFLLLIFFMVTTVLKTFTGLPVNLPSAEMIDKLESRRHVAYIWIAEDGKISVDDKIVPPGEMSAIAKIMYDRRVADPQLVVSLKIDKEAEMQDVSEVQEQLRRADALRVNYATNVKQSSQ